MKLATLIRRSLRYYWRTHLGVVLGSAIATAVLVGALVVGDSVRHTLHSLALLRLGRVSLAVVPQDRFFRSAVAKELSGDLGRPVAAGLVLDGSARKRGAEPPGEPVRVLGVDERFWHLSPRGRVPAAFESLGDEEVLVSSTLADKLHVAVGDVILVKIARPGLLSRDAPLSGSAQNAKPATLTVRGVVDPDDFGRFDLRANQVPAYNVFFPLARLGGRIKLGTPSSEAPAPATAPATNPAAPKPPPEATLAGKANMLLLGQDQTDAADPLTTDKADRALQWVWGLPDANVQVRELPGRGVVELRTGRVFLDSPVARAAAKVPGAMGALTYLVSEIKLGERTTPYSMVSGLGPWPERPSGPAGAAAPGADAASAPAAPPSFAIVPPGLRDDEIVINDWLARDLLPGKDPSAAVGSKVELTYFVLGPGRTFTRKHRTFTVRKIRPLTPATSYLAIGSVYFPWAFWSLAASFAERELMPDFPDLSNTTNCADWDPGLPDDEIRAMKQKILPEDQKYWDDFRGTPKAFVTLRAAQEMWGNRFGNLTAVRWPLSAQSAASVTSAVLKDVRPAQIGLFFQPVRARALKAGAEALDFGSLFLGLSMFLIAAALILTGLLLAFSVQQRTREVGTLLALGFTPRRVRWLLWAEGGALAVAGAVLGVPAGLAYTKLALLGLATLWQGAVAGSAIRFHADPVTLVIGAVCGVAAALLAIWLVLRRQARQPARALLSGEDSWASAAGLRRNMLWRVVAGACAVGAVALAAFAVLAGGEAQVGAFFGAGALLLVATITAARLLLGALGARAAGRRMSLAWLGLQNATRRMGRSLAVVALLACGSFLVIAVAANRRGGQVDVRDPASPTGGFSLYAESAVGILQDLDSDQGRRDLRLPADGMQGVRVVAGRLLEGDEASCLNLNRAQVPRLVGFPRGELGRRGSFRFVQTLPHPAPADPWSLLAPQADEPDVVPAVADQGTLQWALGKGVGDTLDYLDERGRPFQVRIVGAVRSSILQGSVIVDAQSLAARYPSQAGRRVFLIDTPPGRAPAVARTLDKALDRFGFRATPTPERLAAFNEVENTYLAIFQALGALGLLLGSAGLALVVLRNVLERRGELALLRAVGFSRARLRGMILYEHWGLLVLGLACGVVSAAVAVYPAIASAGASVPYVSLAWMLALVAAGGVLWAWLAAAAALRGDLMPALRSE